MKLRNKSITYQVYPNEGIITSVIRSYVVHPRKQDLELTTVGIAHCSPDDTFDENIGKKIARARAEKEAFIQYKRILKDMLKQQCKEVSELQQHIDTVDTYISQQREYIKSF